MNERQEIELLNKIVAIVRAYRLAPGLFKDVSPRYFLANEGWERDFAEELVEELINIEWRNGGSGESAQTSG